MSQSQSHPDEITLTRGQALDILNALHDAQEVYPRLNLFTELVWCEEGIATLTERLWPNEGRL